MAKRRHSTPMISIRVVDGPLAKAEAFCVPVECFRVAGEGATIRLDTALPPGSPPGTPIPVHEYRIPASALTARTSGKNWMMKGPTLATWVRRVEDRVVVEGRWFNTGS